MQKWASLYYPVYAWWQCSLSRTGCRETARTRASVHFSADNIRQTIKIHLKFGISRALFYTPFHT